MTDEDTVSTVTVPSFKENLEKLQDHQQ